MKTVYDPELLGLQVSKVMGSELMVFCPYHSDSQPSAEYNIEKGVFHCFGCHENRTAKELARDLGGVLVPMGVIPDRYREKAGEELDWLKLFANPLAHDNEYLRSREVEEWQVITHQIRVMRDGVIFPIMDKFGTKVGAQVRHFKRQPKYKFYGNRTPIWPMRNLFFGGNFFLTEGIFGWLRAESVMEMRINGGAMMGASAVEGAVKQLKAVPVRPYAVMDSDYAGLLAAGKFVLHDIPAIILEDGIAPDEWDSITWRYVAANPEGYSAHDVMDIINMSSEPFRLQKALEKYYRRM